VTGYDQSSAVTAVKADNKLMRTPGRRKQVGRARELRKTVLVQVREQCARAAAQAFLALPGAPVCHEMGAPMH
jgi:hypothetical protein